MLLRLFTFLFLLSLTQVTQTMQTSTEINDQQNTQKNLSPKALTNLRKALDKGFMDQEVYCCGCFVQKLRRNDYIAMLPLHIRTQLNDARSQSINREDN